MARGAHRSEPLASREYKWKQKQVAEFIDDLADKFLKSHEALSR
jgi:hypothetical protein